jgi:hypothetical protein
MDAARFDTVEDDEFSVALEVWDAAACHDDVVPDELDGIATVAGMMSTLAAEQYSRVEALRRSVRTQTVPFYGATSQIAERSLQMELAAELRITAVAAQRLLHDADRLVNRYPAMLDALAAARTTPRHAEILVELVEPVEDALLDAVMGPAVRCAVTQPAGTFRRTLRGIVEQTRAATLEQRHREALEDRRVVIEDALDGMSWLLALVPSVEARAIMNRATAMAASLRSVDGEERTLDQLRSDIVCDLLIDGQTDAHPSATRGIHATVAVTVPALTLLDDPHPGSGPAVVEGVGPIPRERARELCGTAPGWTRVLTHPETGVVLSVGRDQYTPPAPMKRFLRLRAARCMGPGCAMPATRCELDHTIAFSDGGHTAVDNLAPLCKNQHTLKHHGGWTLRHTDRHGTLEWTSPTGRTYTVAPHPQGPPIPPHPPGPYFRPEPSGAPLF